jgi:Protein of unknown function (DUF1236)
MRTLASLFVVASLAIGAPLALADDLVIAPEVGIKFQNDVKVKKYKSHKYDGDLKVGVVVPADVEVYGVPDDIIVATPALKGHTYVYLNDRVYVVDSGRHVVAVAP